MASVIFYEKPGCVTNAKQKRWLQESGHEVIVKNLLEHDWHANELLEYFDGLPVSQWFNQSAPRIKSGEIVPEYLNASMAVSLMLGEPLLIRRPLMEVNGTRMVGFVPKVVDRWIGLNNAEKETDPVCPML